MGGELSCTPGKRGGGGLERENVLSPFPPLVSTRFFFLREFFSGALLSERLEQARRPQVPIGMLSNERIDFRASQVAGRG